MKLLFVAVLISVPLLTTCSKKSSAPLYTKEDDVTVLDVDNFENEVMNSNTSWFVMFYSQWCGHCKHFAPTYKKLATDMKGWKNVIRLGAVDCSAKSETTGSDNGMKICFRKPFFIGGMPDCRLFPPFSDSSTKGIKRKFLGKKTFGSDGKLKEDSDSYDNVKNDLLDLLQDHHQPSLNLDFLKKSEMENLIEDNNEESLVMVVEPRKSSIGKQLKLDIMSAGGKTRVARISNRNKKAIKILEEKFKVEIQPSRTCALVATESKTTKIVYYNEPDYQGFKQHVLQQLPDIGDIETTDEVTTTKPTEEVDGGGDRVLMSQLEMALHYILRKEVAGKESLEHKDLANLKNFVNVVTQFFPGRKSTMKFMRKIRKLISNKETVDWEDWQQILQRVQYTVGSFLSSHEDYSKSCSSFPCCFWQLCHVIMTQYYRTAPDMDPHLVLKAMTGYMESFFTCEECRRNWTYETEDMNDFVDDATSALLYLWKKHNSVNRRLSKPAWPSKEQCPQCWKENGVFELEKVEEFLADFYHFEKISHEGVREEDEPVKNDENQQENSASGGKDEL